MTPLEQVNERIHEITELVRGHLQDFLSIYGITLNDVKVLIRPRDERMRELISLRAFGLSEIEAVRYYVAMKMAERGLVSAPNMAVGEPFNIGMHPVGTALPGMPSWRTRPVSAPHGRARARPGRLSIDARQPRRSAARPARLRRLHRQGPPALRRSARQAAGRPRPRRGVGAGSAS